MSWALVTNSNILGIDVDVKIDVDVECGNHRGDGRVSREPRCELENVAITGMGAITSLGLSVVTFVEGLETGRTAISAAPWADPENGLFPWISRIDDFRADEWMDRRVEEGTDVFAQYALAAVQQAVYEHGAELAPRRTGVVLGTTMAGVRSLLGAQRLLERDGPGAVPKKLNIQAWPNMAAGQVALRWHLHGPLLTVSTACASSLDAIGIAARMIERGDADVVICGGSESGLCDTLYYSQLAYGMSMPVERADRASMPFDVDRAGIVEGEGAAAVVLERADHASARGATIHGYVRGYGSIADSYHPSSPDPSGEWEAEAMRLALDDADHDISDRPVDAIIAHGTGTPLGDSAEIRAIHAVYGSSAEGLLVTSVKGNVGHTGAASGAMSVIAALRAIARNTLPPTANTTKIDPEARFTVVVERPASSRLRAIQVNSFGFGGQDASLVVCGPTDSA